MTRNRPMAALALGLLSLACAGSQGAGALPALDQGDSLRYPLLRIEVAQRSGRAEAVAAEHEEAAARAPQDAALRILAGKAATRNGRAVEHYRAALDLSPDAFWAHLGLAEVYLRMGILRRAEPELEAALGLRPQSAAALALQGDLLQQQKRPKEAIEAYQRALERDAGEVRAHLGLGTIYATSGNRKSALRELELAADAEPRNLELHLRLGAIAEAEGQLPAAQRAYRRATQINPNKAPAWLALGRAQRRLDLLEDATSSLQRCLELDSASTEARLELAAVRTQAGAFEDAEDLYRQVLQGQPELPAARLGLAQSYEAAGNLAESLELRQALATQDASQAEAAEALLQRLAVQREPVSGRSLQQVFDRLLVALQGCHERLARRAPLPKGGLTFSVTVDEAGRAAAVELLDDGPGSPELAGCATWTLKQARFPKGRPATVTFPVSFP